VAAVARLEPALTLLLEQIKCATCADLLRAGGVASVEALSRTAEPQLAALGVEVRVTEMDVTCGGYSHSCDDNVG
jgi:hypothetical protein